MLLQPLKRIKLFVSTIGEMIRLVWDASTTIFTTSMVLTILQSMSPVVLAWLSKLLFDTLAQALQMGWSAVYVSKLASILVIQGCILAASDAVKALDAFLRAELSRRLTVVIQTSIGRKIGSFAGIRYFEDPSFHDQVRLASQGAQLGPEGIIDTGSTLLQSAITLVGFISILLTLSPLLAVLALLAALPQFYARIKMSGRSFELILKISPTERRLHYYNFLLSDPQTAKEIRLFGLLEHFVDELVRTYKRIHSTKRDQELRELRWRLALILFSATVSTGIFITVVLQAVKGGLTLGDVPLYMNAVTGILFASTGLFAALAGLNEQTLFFSEYRALDSLPQPIVIKSSPLPAQALTAGIEFRNVWFRYADHLPWVLRDCSFKIPTGKCTALVGLNGVGKTTLVKLLTRLYDPLDGQILWNGIDIQEFEVEGLRAQIGVVLQDFMRYALTAHENIGMGDVQHIDGDDWVYRAAKMAGIHEKIKSLPLGYETILNRWLDEDGMGTDLSGGEWQGVALARVFMRKASLFVLDEPTADLDAQAEASFYDRFSKLIGGHTSLIISHRFSTVKMADVVAVLEQGQISEYGSHEELLSLEGAYARLYSMQAERYALK